jgi:hypothetical protein
MNGMKSRRLTMDWLRITLVACQALSNWEMEVLGRQDPKTKETRRLLTALQDGLWWLYMESEPPESDIWQPDWGLAENKSTQLWPASDNPFRTKPSSTFLVVRKQ